jgi:RNA polymerase sigma factor (sigma-70 family)
MDLDDADVAQFLDEHADWVLRLATVLSPSRQDGEDAAQEVLIRAIRHLRRVRGARSPRAYLRRMVINEILRRPQLRTTMAESASEDESHLERGYAHFEARTEVNRLLHELPPRQSAAIALRFLEECEYREVARTLRCREATARSLVKRGLDQLRAASTAEDRIRLEG